MTKNWIVRSYNDPEMPSLVVHADTERIALQRAAEAVVRWHCAHNNLPYYEAKCAMFLRSPRTWAEFKQEVPDPRPRVYQADRYIADGERDAQGNKLPHPARGVRDPEAEPGMRGLGHFVPCRGLWTLEEEGLDNGRT